MQGSAFHIDFNALTHNLSELPKKKEKKQNWRK